MDSTELLYTLALSYVNGLGNIGAKKLIQHYKSAQTVWNLPKKELIQIKGLPQRSIIDFANAKYLALAEKEIELSKQQNIRLHSFLHPSYPSRLKECLDSPVVLFAKGNMDLESKKVIAIVGTRKMTNYGKKFIVDLLHKLSDYEICVVSGLALGCDIAAHKHALKNKLQTVAVLAHGLNQISPKSNQKEAIEMQKNGGLVSEYSSFHVPQPVNFLKRNRIIAGLSDLVIVVESNFKGGAMSTAKHANQYNREVMALPGRIIDAQSKGCNHLIATNQAWLIRNADDLLYHLNLESKKPIQTKLLLNLSADEQKIYDYLAQKGKTQIDSLAIGLQTNTHSLMPVLLNLELKNVVQPLPGKFFEII